MMDQQAIYNGLAILAGILFAAAHMWGFRATLRRRILEGKQDTGQGLVFGLLQIALSMNFLCWPLGMLPGVPAPNGSPWPMVLFSSVLFWFSVVGLVLNIQLRSASLEDLNESVRRLWDACRKLPNTSEELEMAGGAVTLRKDKTGRLIIQFEGMEIVLERRRGSIGYVEEPELAKSLPLKEAIKEIELFYERLTELVEQETLPWGIKTQSSIRKRALTHQKKQD